MLFKNVFKIQDFFIAISTCHMLKQDEVLAVHYQHFRKIKKNNKYLYKKNTE